MWYWIKSSERPPKWPGRWSIWCMKKSWEKCGWVLLLVGWVGGVFLSLKTRQGGTYWHCLIRKGWMEERWTQSQTLLSGAHKRRAKPTRHTQEIHIFKDRIYFTIKLVKHQQRGPESVWILHPQGRSMFIWMRHLTSCLNFWHQSSSALSRGLDFLSDFQRSLPTSIIPWSTHTQNRFKLGDL